MGGSNGIGERGASIGQERLEIYIRCDQLLLSHHYRVKAVTTALLDTPIRSPMEAF